VVKFLARVLSGEVKIFTLTEINCYFYYYYYYYYYYYTHH